MGAIKGHRLSDTTKRKISLAATNRKRVGEIHNTVQPEGYIALCLSVLREAKKTRSKMWEEFRREFHISRRYRDCSDPPNIALWVVNFWRRNQGNPIFERLHKYLYPKEKIYGGGNK